jgi:glycosyltransferase involved in cell wall biosynthesis
VIVTDDVHWLRMEKLATSRKNSGITHHGGNSAMSPEAEVAAVRLSEYQNYANMDGVITISSTDRRNILRYDVNRQLSVPAKLMTVPFVASPWETQESLDIPDFINRRGLIFVGNLANPTNIEGLRWFLKVVMPMLTKRIPGVTITIIGGGKWPISEIKPTEAYIRFLGWLSWDHMRQELNAARVFVSPIVVSTGVNTKNSLAMSNGVPLITTAIGAAGLCQRCDSNPLSIDSALDTSGEGGLHLAPGVDCPFIVAADHEEFTRGVLEVYNDEIIWNMFSRLGLENTQNFLSVRNEAHALEDVLGYVTTGKTVSGK